jgi:L-threonylcarbamoyladenylate synthase
MLILMISYFLILLNSIYEYLHCTIDIMKIDDQVITTIKNGGVGVMPTDTIYGVVASVKFPEAIERIYSAKKRPNDKRFIVLIGNRGQLPSLGINPNLKQVEVLNEFWPGPFSMAMACDDTLPYLHNEKFSIAVRLPAETWLRHLINETGPIVATSANISNEATPNNIEDIKSQLPGLDFYIEGPVNAEPSKLGILNEKGEVFWLRGM